MTDNGSLIIRVPASTSNLGPGFDALGLALNLYNDFTVRRLKADSPSKLVGRGASEGVKLKDNPFFRTVDRVCALSGRVAPALEVTVDGTVPLGVGLGSSAGACVAGALAANTLMGSPFSYEELLGPIIDIEGHPDNASPSLLGGLTLTAQTAEGPLVHLYQPHADWRLAVLIPDYTISTRDSRRRLPRKVSRTDAVFNLQRLPMVIDALVNGDAEHLGCAMEDRLHQPRRRRAIKRYKKICQAALKAGAAATFISGSGPALAAVCRGEKTAQLVADAMKQAVRKAPFKAGTLVLQPVIEGARIAEPD